MLEAADADPVRAQAERTDDVFAISAVTGEGLDAFLSAVADVLQGESVEETLQVSFADGRRRAWLFERDLVLEEQQSDTGFDLKVRWSAKDRAQFEGL